MKKSIIILFLILPLQIFGQLQKSSGVPLYVNFLVNAQIDGVMIDKQFAPLIGLSASCMLNNRLFFGVFGETKVMKISSNLEAYPDKNINYTNLGVIVGFYQNLGLKRQSNSYVKRKAKLCYTLKMGGGRYWMKEPSDNSKISEMDYFYTIVPNVSIEWPLGDNFSVGCGLDYRFHFVVDKFYSNKDFNSPGVFVNAKANIFNSSYFKKKVRPIF